MIRDIAGSDAMAWALVMAVAAVPADLAKLIRPNALGRLLR